MSLAFSFRTNISLPSPTTPTDSHSQPTPNYCIPYQQCLLSFVNLPPSSEPLLVRPLLSFDPMLFGCVIFIYLFYLSPLSRLLMLGYMLCHIVYPSATRPVRLN